MAYFSKVKELPPDPLFGLKARYTADPRPVKVDLGIGAYRDDNGLPWILPSVKLATAKLIADPNFNHEYLPITGYPAFVQNAAKLILGDVSAARPNLVSIQTLSGTGALHIVARLISDFYAGPKTIYISNPTWANHAQIFELAGLSVQSYPYWNEQTRSLDIDGMLGCIRAAPQNLVFLLHACAHNPTGLDPNRDQWKLILHEIEQNKHLVLFDSAYQGFASGDLEKDSWAIRYAVGSNVISSPVMVCQSFAKNCGMYGERVGALHVVLPTDSTSQVSAYKSQLAKIARSEFSNPPAFGAKVVATVLTDPALYLQWQKDLITMLSRIGDMRRQLRYLLEHEYKTPGKWDHITSQQGMFSFTALNAAQVARLEQVHGVYMVLSGRALVAGLNPNNVNQVAKAIDEVVRFQEMKL